MKVIDYRATKPINKLQIMSANYEVDKSHPDEYELKIGLKYDYQAFMIYDNKNNMKMPRVRGIDTRNAQLLTSRVFKSLVKDE